jgi:predicted porin
VKLFPLPLCCLALLGPFACAQNAVTVYGVVDLALMSDSNSGQSQMAVNSGQQTASRLGFKGTEALGGGWNASFLVESQIEADTGQPSYAGRPFGSQAWVGLSGPFGAIKMGRIFTPYFGAIATNDPFDAKGPGESTRVFQDSGVRMDNTIKYSLPPLGGGWYGDIAYGAGETAANSAAHRQLSMDAGYAQGPLNVVVAHHRTNDGAGASAARSTLVGGNYDFGAIRAWMVIARSRNDSTLDTQDLLIGLSMPFGRSSVAADYVHKRDKYHSDANATQLALGYYYTLSPRSNVYLIASRLANEGAASYQAMLPGGTRRLIGAGMRHQF